MIPLLIIEVGHSYHFKLNVDPVNGIINAIGYDLNSIDSFGVVNDTCSAMTADNVKYYFRLHDYAWATNKFSNFAFYNNAVDGDGFHTHSDAWLTEDENKATTIAFTEDNKLAYNFECYCGQTVTYGISEVAEEKILPMYGISDETVIISEFISPNKNFWFVGQINAKEYPTENGKALITVGDDVLLTVDADGRLMGTDTVLPVDGKYYSIALRFDISLKKYTIYFDGEYIADAYYETIGGDIKFASNGAGKYHFDRAAVVILADNGDISYKTADEAHIHRYDSRTSLLEFNAERSTITINYTCVECDKLTFDGISENLYDNAETAEVEIITPVFGIETRVLTSERLTSEDSYWFSFDAILKSELKRGGGALFKFIDNENNEIAVLTIYYDGSICDAQNKKIAKALNTNTNITINVIENNGEYSYILYIDGKYVGEYSIALDDEKIYSIALGADFATSLEITEIKFANLENGGTLSIGTFVCADDEHESIIDKKSSVEYFDVNQFKFTYRCARCGKTITEQITKTYYEETPHVYTAYGDMNAVKTSEKSNSYWIVVDINLRGYIGYRSDYVPLISDNGVAVLLVGGYYNDLMLADGTRIYTALEAKKTYNVALKYQDGTYYLFLNGKYMGCTTGSNFKEGISSENSYEYFGSSKLQNIRYYNIKLIETGITDTPVIVAFVEDTSVIPCAHDYHNFYNVEVVFDDVIKEIYTCNKCGERIVRVNSKNILDIEENSFISNGGFTVSDYTPIKSSEEYMSIKGAPYWVRFTVDFEEFASAATLNGENGKNKDSGRGFFDTGGSGYGHILRIFSVKNNDGSFSDGVVELRNGATRNAKLIATVHEGETHEFVIGVVPSSGRTVIYMDGKFILESNSAGAIAQGKTSYQFRFLDGKWGTFNISDFEFITAGNHEHTPAYVPYIKDGYNVLAYTDATLTHRYTCYCGAKVVEGIFKIFKDPIEKVENASEFVNIAEDKTINMGVEPYWLSAKVYSSGATNIYSYGMDIRLVETDSMGYFVVDGCTTNVKASVDYDVVSVKIFPITGKYDVYVNGSYLSSGNAEFKSNENFKILFGGNGSQVSYSNIKLVRLADCAEGRVIAFDCSNHDINNLNQMIKTVTLDENNKVCGIEYNCILECGYKVTSKVDYCEDLYDISLNTGNDALNFDYADSITMSGVKYLYTTENVIGRSANPFWLSFDVTVNEIYPDKITSYTDGNNMLNIGVNMQSPLRVYKVKTNGVDIAVDENDVSDTTLAIRSHRNSNGIILGYLEKGTEISISLYCRPIEGDVDIYINGEYKITRTGVFSGYNPLGSHIRFMETAWADITIDNFGIYRTEIGECIFPDESKKMVKPHFPKSGETTTFTYDNGNIVHEFTCACGCGNNIKLQSFVNLQNPELNTNKIITELLNIRRQTNLNIDEKHVVNGATPYYLAFNVTAESLEQSLIKGTGGGGASFLSLTGVGNNDIPTVDRSIFRLYYEDGKIYLGNSKIKVEMVKGENYSVVLAVNPITQRAVCSINGVIDEFNFSVESGRTEYYFRFVFRNWGEFDFTDLKFGYLTDVCAHLNDSKTCVEAGGNTFDCKECNGTALSHHNYVATNDLTWKWTLYTCADCGEYFTVFKDMSLVEKMTFATEELLMEYLVKTYPPMFVRFFNK